MQKIISTILIFLTLLSIPAQAVSTYQPYFIGDGTALWGSYRRIAFNGNIDWYFTNLAMLNGNFTNAELKVYLNIYLQRTNARNSTIQNVDSNLITLLPPDSHDSYASTFLSLAKKYYDQSQDINWLINNQTRLRVIADRNLVNQIKPNNLIPVFQSPNPYNVGFLMDNVENYKGLKDFDKLTKNLNTYNTTYLNASNRVLQGIQSLRDPNIGAYRWCDICTVESTFYPSVTANMFLRVYDIPNINYNEVNTWIENTKPNLATTKNDDFPWLMVAQYYQKRNDQTRLNQYLNMVDTNFTPYSSTYPIHDWAIRQSFN